MLASRVIFKNVKPYRKSVALASLLELALVTVGHTYTFSEVRISSLSLSYRLITFHFDLKGFIQTLLQHETNKCS